VANGNSTLACVLGDMDLVRPLGLAGIKCAVAVQPGAAPRYSRYTSHVIEWASPWENPNALVDSLIDFAKTQSERPVLFYESDGELLLVSRNRERLGKYFRFVVADAVLVEDLVDKERFQKLAEKFSLPVPRARHLQPHEPFKTEDLELVFPIVVKPLTRRPELWRSVTELGKALRVNTAEELRQLWPRLAASGIELLAQELIDGPETQIESYHVYIDDRGDIVGEFTGRKIRTYPLEHGDSTALETTDAGDVRELGRTISQQIGLRGVAKFDFKRSPDGKLFLLEINPRFNLWHHLGALAGANLPALVYNDLTGTSRSESTNVRAGLSWTRVWQDAQAVHAAGQSMAQWLKWTSHCEAKRLLSWDDPMAFIGAALWKLRDKLKSKFGTTSPKILMNQVEMGGK